MRQRASFVKQALIGTLGNSVPTWRQCLLQAREQMRSLVFGSDALAT